MSSIVTCLIEKNALIREGLKSLLSGTAFSVFESYADLDAMVMHCDRTQPVGLIIVGVDDGIPSMEDDIRQLKNRYPESRVVVLTTRMDPNNIIAAFIAGADGYLLRDVAPPVLLGFLNVILLGEKVYPTSVLSTLLNGAAEPQDLSSLLYQYNLSDRQLQILECLADGDTNKQIANHLDITEATVKVHIKSVLRKLSVSNRTQAAIWAVNEGLGRAASVRQSSAMV